MSIYKRARLIGGFGGSPFREYGTHGGVLEKSGVCVGAGAIHAVGMLRADTSQRLW
ncbi:hypothetical protein [Paraburkholderia sp. JHI869]|uniref:hypothetical protein n=1 Tax=Paraburkholderia sp. JHI869 TaxID=3112959 RepID=UPI00316C9E52